jgi:hypothetical protein
VLPTDLRKRSLSTCEPVFVLNDAIAALAAYEAAGWAQLGWETWLKYPGGKHGRAPTRTLTVERGDSEGWRDFVKRTHDICVETIRAMQLAWEGRSQTEDEVLYFCLTQVQPQIHPPRRWPTAPPPTGGRLRPRLRGLRRP